MSLPNTEVSFDFDGIGAETGKKYEGTFTVRCILSIAQKQAMELERTRLTGGYANPTDELYGIALILSTLRAKIVTGAPFWEQGKGADIFDENILVALHNKIKEVSIQWKEKIQQVKPELTSQNPA